VVEYYPSNNITVTGRAHMGPISVTGKPDYYFDYTAKVDNGFLETWDASGWTNKTGARRVDWEKTSQMMGEKIDVTNHLEVKSLFAPGAGGGEDWLPCCGNTMAYVNKSMYDGEDWPNKNQRSIFDCSCPAGPSTEIDPMNPAEEAAPSGKFLTGQFSGPRISVTSSVDEPESGNKSTYTITVQNTGVKDLKDIWLNASIPNDFGYTAVPNPKTAVGQKIIWGFDDLKAGQYQTVTLNVQSTESALTADDLKETTVYAEANYGGSMVTDGPKESNVIYHGYD
jgi:hypothetical protein